MDLLERSMGERCGKRVLVISPAGEVYDHDKVRWYSQTREQILDNYFNIGDMVVYDSTLKMLDFAEVRPLSIIDPKPEHVEEYKNYDYVIVRASNFIHNQMKWHRALEVLSQLDLPVYAIGVGAQASGRQNYHLEGENLAFWKLVSERSKVIGVRGSFTADMLSANGIKNVEICGCPSILRMRKRNLNIVVPPRIENVAFSIRREVDRTYSDDVHGYLRAQSDLLLRMAGSFATTVTIHGEPEEKAYYFRDEARMAAAKDEFIRTGWWNSENFHDMEEIYRSRLFFFLCVSDYDDFIRRQDFAFGYRVHGVLPALANGIPAALIRYDSRSGELADALAIPSVSADEAGRVPPQKLIEEVDFAAFNKAFSTKYDKMKFVLEQNEVAHRL